MNFEGIVLTSLAIALLAGLVQLLKQAFRAIFGKRVDGANVNNACTQTFSADAKKGGIDVERDEIPVAKLGTPLIALFCAECGSPTVPMARFCSKCGHGLVV